MQQEVGLGLMALRGISQGGVQMSQTTHMELRIVRNLGMASTIGMMYIVRKRKGPFISWRLRIQLMFGEVITYHNTQDDADFSVV